MNFDLQISFPLFSSVHTGLNISFFMLSFVVCRVLAIFQVSHNLLAHSKRTKNFLFDIYIISLILLAKNFFKFCISSPHIPLLISISIHTHHVSYPFSSPFPPGQCSAINERGSAAPPVSRSSLRHNIQERRATGSGF